MKRPLLTALALLVATPAFGVWREASTDKFIVYSEDSEKRLIEFTERVDRFDQLLRIIMRRTDSPAPVKVRVYLVNDAQTVSEIEPSHPLGINGFYQTSISGGIGIVNGTRVSREDQLDGETTLCHEYAHHFMAQYLVAAYPRWYQEGFAELFSNVKFRSNGDVTLGRPPLYRGGGLFAAAWLGTAKLMDGAGQKVPVEAFYAQSWLLTHYFFDNSQRGAQFKHYLQLRNQGASHQQAMVQAFGLTDAELDKELRAYLARGEVGTIEFKALKFTTPRLTVRQLPRWADALLLPDLRMETGPKEGDGKKLLDSVRSKAEHFQGDDETTVILARAEARFGDRARAMKLLTPLTQKEPPNRRALLELATLELSGTEEDPDQRLASDRRARTRAAKANRLDPNDPEALFLFYQSFAHESGGPTKNALDGLEQAHANLPQYGPITMSFVSELVRAHETKRAIQVLRPLAFAPHGGDAAKWAQAELKELEAGAKDTAGDAAPQTESSEK